MMYDQRRIAADKAFAECDLGDEEVKGTGTWQSDKDEWWMHVYLENGDEPSRRVIFVVKFKPDSVDVLESYPAW